MKRNKKGFTVVELSIVIVVIAILAAILIPTMISLVNKANVANDTALVRNLNTALALDGGEKHETMQDALDAAKDAGYDVAKINAKATDNEILWDSANDVFCYMKDEDGKQTITYVPETTLSVKNVKNYQYWVVASAPSSTYSTYLYNYKGTGTEEISTGIDVGENVNFTKITYKTDAEQSVIIRTVGNSCELEIDAAKSDIDYYGFAKKITVTAVKDSSLHIFGSTNDLSVEKGHVVVESDGIVFNVSALADSVTITNSGFIANAATDAIKTKIAESGNAVSTEYEIGSLEKLETFRDAVNIGNNFAGITVKLTADITLKDGWAPISEGSRDVGKGEISAQNTTTFFAGIFDGQNHTISNLNNKGFEPNQKRLVKDGNDNTYAYGLFALVDGATIKDLTFSNVDIDTSRYNNAVGDSVAALVGYAKGEKVEITNIKVSGSVKANDAVGGVVGRSYAETTTVKSCHNSATVEGAKAAGILGYANKGNLVVENNENSGNISTGVKGAGIVVFSLGSDMNGKSVTIKSNKNSGTITRTASITGINATPEISYIAQGGSGGNLDNSNGNLSLYSDKYLSSWDLTGNTNDGGKLICKEWDNVEITLSSTNKGFKQDFIIRGQGQKSELNGMNGTKSSN